MLSVYESHGAYVFQQNIEENQLHTWQADLLTHLCINNPVIFSIMLNTLRRLVCLPRLLWQRAVLLCLFYIWCFCPLLHHETLNDI